MAPHTCDPRTQARGSEAQGRLSYAKGFETDTEHAHPSAMKMVNKLHYSVNLSEYNYLGRMKTCVDSKRTVIFMVHILSGMTVAYKSTQRTLFTIPGLW